MKKFVSKSEIKRCVILISLLFIYTIFVLVEFIRSIVQYMRQSKIKKYSSSVVSIMKYKYLVW